MKFVVGFEKAKTTHTQTRVPARLISGCQGVDRTVANSGQGASQSCQPEEKHENRAAGKAGQTRINKVHRKSRGIQLRTDADNGYSKTLEIP